MYPEGSAFGHFEKFPFSIKTTNVMQLEAMSSLFLGKHSTCFGALCTYYQECLKTAHAGTGTIMYRYDVRSGLLKGTALCHGTVLYTPDS